MFRIEINRLTTVFHLSSSVNTSIIKTLSESERSILHIYEFIDLKFFFYGIKTLST